MSLLKQNLHRACLARIEERVARSQNAIEEARAAANEETKSSAGDKYETGRSMMQLEMEQHAGQLTEALKLKSAFLKIKPDVTTRKIQSGSLVKTNLGSFYIAVSVGEFEVDGNIVFTISPSSPIGTQLIAGEVGHSFSMNGKSYTIESVE